MSNVHVETAHSPVVINGPGCGQQTAPAGTVAEVIGTGKMADYDFTGMDATRGAG